MSYLTEPVLVLNKSWIPVSITTVRRSLKLFFTEGASFVCPDNYEIFSFENENENDEEMAGFERWILRDSDKYVKTSTLAIPVPEILVLSSYDKIPKDRSSYSKKNVYKRDRYLCQYCGEFPGIELLTIDHVIPRSHGGKSTWENCVVACSACNSRKANKSLFDVGMKLASTPKRPFWSPIALISSKAQKPSWGKFLKGRQ